MSAGKKLKLVSVENYLAGELVASVKHEYLAGVVYAMAGASNAHNTIATNTLVALGSRLRGRACQPFNSDTKIRVQLPTHVRFYYPDASVVCQPNSQDESYQDHPVVICEVLSRSMRRIDEGEKKGRLSDDSVAGDGGSRGSPPHRARLCPRGLHEGQRGVIPLAEIEIELPLADIYDRVEFRPEPVNEEEELR